MEKSTSDKTRLYERSLLHTDVLKYNSSGNLISRGSAKKQVTSKEILRRTANSEISPNGFRPPNPFTAHYFDLVPFGHQVSPKGAGFVFGTYETRYDNHPAGKAINITRAEGIGYSYNADMMTLRDRSKYRDRYEMESLVITGSYNSLKNSPVHLGMMLGTLGETLGFVAMQYRTFSTALRLLRKGKVRKAAHILIDANTSLTSHGKLLMRKKAKRIKEPRLSDTDYLDVLSSKWLELQFAWGPLLDDIYGLMTMVPDVTAQASMPRVTGRNVLIRNYDDLRKERTSGSYPYGPIVLTETTATSTSVALCRTDWTVGNAKLYMLSMAGLVNPLEVIWDKVPYSFVIDWFIPISSWISAMTADAGLEYLGGSLTFSSETKLRTDIYPWFHELKHSSFTTKFKDRVGFSGLDHSTTRVILPGPPPLRFPPVRYPTELWHAITGGALLYQTKDLITKNVKFR